MSYYFYRELSSLPISENPRPQEETIAAISTPVGESGIGIVRVSGPLSERIVNSLFKPRKDRSRLTSHHFYYGEIVDPQTGRPLDEVLIVLMRSPATYTREDMAEIQCHGGYLVLRKILESVLSQGARLAEPGEFTKRAFLNGRIDLTQAEAVIDVIRARTTTGLEIAHSQLKGALLTSILSLRERLVENLALIEAHIDFAEEEIPSLPVDELYRDFNEMNDNVKEWIDSYEEGKILREGVSCAIIGKTNVGKSSLMNVLLREERAIVTPVPGTTRDVIEDALNIEGIPLRLLDTAGLRETSDLVEQEGVRRTRERIGSADLLLVVLDGSCELDGDDRRILEEVEGRKKVLTVNKNDLPLKIDLDEVRKSVPDDPIVSISCLKGERIEDLKKAIFSVLVHRSHEPSAERLIVSNLRHKNALVQAGERLENVLRGVREGVSLEFIAFEVRSVLEALGTVVGETTPEEVLDLIFDQFCIGK